MLVVEIELLDAKTHPPRRVYISLARVSSPVTSEQPENVSGRLGTHAQLNSTRSRVGPRLSVHLAQPSCQSKCRLMLPTDMPVSRPCLFLELASGQLEAEAAVHALCACPC